MTSGVGSKGTKKSYGKRGKRTLAVEVLGISSQGVWLLADGKEYFAAHADFPWFKRASVAEVFKVRMPAPGHIFWPELDVDVAIESLADPERFPLVAKTVRAAKKSKR
jgi:hypothetical protein